MIDGSESIYKRIADGMASAIQEPWSLATISVVFYSDGSDYVGEYVAATGAIKSFEITIEPTRAFRELRRKFKEANQAVWGQAEFELKADGTFRLQWGYADVDEDGNTIWDEEAWKRRQEERRGRLS